MPVVIVIKSRGASVSLHRLASFKVATGASHLGMPHCGLITFGIPRLGFKPMVCTFVTYLLATWPNSDHCIVEWLKEKTQ